MVRVANADLIFIYCLHFPNLIILHSTKLWIFKDSSTTSLLSSYVSEEITFQTQLQLQQTNNKNQELGAIDGTLPAAAAISSNISIHDSNYVTSDSSVRESNFNQKRTCMPSNNDDNNMVLVVMCNQQQVKRIADTVHGIRINGTYTGDIVVMYAKDDLLPQHHSFFEGLNVQYKEFPKNIDKYNIPADLPGHGPMGRGFNQTTAWIYFFKFHVFDPYFAKHWCRVLYIDGGIRVNSDISHYLKTVYPTDKLLAHSDSYPMYRWKLHVQFADFKQIPSLPYKKFELMEEYDNLEVDYPQSTVLYFNTKTVITHDPGLKEKLYDLQRKWLVGTTMEQSYIALYFTKIRPIWEEFPYVEEIGKRFYDYCHVRPWQGIKRPVLLSKHACRGLG